MIKFLVSAIYVRPIDEMAKGFFGIPTSKRILKAIMSRYPLGIPKHIVAASYSRLTSLSVVTLQVGTLKIVVLLKKRRV